MFKTADFLSINNKIMASKPDVLQVINETYLYGRYEIPTCRNNRKFPKRI